MRKTGIILVVILFCSFAQADAKSISPQAESYSVKNSDPGILYDWFTSAGGPATAIGDRTWGYCKVWVQTVITKSYHDAKPRNNPDGTFYPGDGFGYGFAYGWAGDASKCRNFSVCPVTSKNISPGVSECKSAKPLAQKAPYGGMVWFVSGMAEISPDENAGGHFISLQISAERWGCYHPKKAPMVCGWGTISTTGMFSPSVIRPAVELAISQQYLNDDDGYKSGNLDHTYYIWDAINLVHNPLYLWKKERAGTLTVKITKQYDLRLELEFQCEKTWCDYTLVQKGFEPWQRQYEYGSGTTLYNATGPDDIRKHAISYKIELFNLGRPIHVTQNKTDVLVVSYDPKYQSYPYLVLADQYWWAWGNRHAVALKYLGSMGGGPDDTDSIHTERRSKINSFEYAGYAFDPITPRMLNQSLLWSQAGPANPSDCSYSDDDSLESRGNTAVFTKAGYGRVSFFWPILWTMLEKRYINATIQNELRSENFAGLAQKNLTQYLYQYPDVKFNNPVKILTYHSDGSRTSLPISVVMKPDLEKGAQYIQDYTCSKVLFDTNSTGLASIVVGDMYDRKNEGSGTGQINMKTQMTSVWFAPFYSVLINDTRDLPISEGYKTLSPYEITITVGEKTRTIHRLVNFLSPFVHVANLDSDNVLNVTQKSGFIRINPDEKFGEIVKVLINGMELQEDCTNGCTTVSSDSLDIEAYNEWGGLAVAHLQEFDESKPDYGINWGLASIAIVVAISGFIVYKFTGRALEHLGFRKV